MPVAEALKIRVAPISVEFLHNARVNGTDALGQPVKRVTAEGGEPCRDVMRRARPGEELILASYSPFTRVGPYHEYGPIFILANESDERADRDAFPVAGTPGDYLNARFVIRAYNEAEEIIDAALIEAKQSDETIDRFLSQPEVAFLHVRFPVYGCFALRVDRD
jgi:hypothetical protein